MLRMVLHGPLLLRRPERQSFQKPGFVLEFRSAQTTRLWPPATCATHTTSSGRPAHLRASLRRKSRASSSPSPMGTASCARSASHASASSSVSVPTRSSRYGASSTLPSALGSSCMRVLTTTREPARKSSSCASAAPHASLSSCCHTSSSTSSVRLPRKCSRRTCSTKASLRRCSPSAASFVLPPPQCISHRSSSSRSKSILLGVRPT